MGKATEFETAIASLRQAYLVMRRERDQELARFEVGWAQVDVLMQLWADDGLGQREIQERLGVTAPTFTGVVDTMIERGYVERRPSAVDGRIKHLFLTRRGRDLRDELCVASERFAERALAGFSATEVALFREWLQRLAGNLEEEPDG